MDREALLKLCADSYEQGVADALGVTVQLIKELRPAIMPLEGMGAGKTTQEWFDILAAAINEKLKEKNNG